MKKEKLDTKLMEDRRLEGLIRTLDIGNRPIHLSLWLPNGIKVRLRGMIELERREHDIRATAIFKQFGGEMEVEFPVNADVVKVEDNEKPELFLKLTSEISEELI